MGEWKLERVGAAAALMTAAELAALLGMTILSLMISLAGSAISPGTSSLLFTLAMTAMPPLLAYLAGGGLRQWKPEIGNGERLAGVTLNLAAGFVLFVTLAAMGKAMAEIVLFLLPVAAVMMAPFFWFGSRR